LKLVKEGGNKMRRLQVERSAGRRGKREKKEYLEHLPLLSICPPFS
jgi:hypothetical protein